LAFLLSLWPAGSAAESALAIYATAAVKKSIMSVCFSMKRVISISVGERAVHVE
jgi:hypothetical protein